VSSSPVVVRALAPGLSGSGTFTVRNGTRDAATVRMTALKVVDRENACLRPEQRVATERCSQDVGELSDWLGVVVSRRQGASETRLWSGSLAQLRRGAKLAGVVPAGSSWTIRVSLGLPVAAGNDTMTDSVSFALRLDAACRLGEYRATGPAVHVGGGQVGHDGLRHDHVAWPDRAWRSASRRLASLASWPGRVF
jgi:hypothetical protein